MGCSYDGPYAGPSEEEIKLNTDFFQYTKWGLNSYCICEKCGATITGSPSLRKWIDIHISVCPGRTKDS